MSDYSKEWFNKAETDYFSAFIKLWLAFNAWYKREYRSNNFGSQDRKYIEAIKANNNRVKERFTHLFDEETDNAREFRLHFMELVTKYNGGLFSPSGKILKSENVKPQMNGQPLAEISFKEFIHPKSFQLKRNPKKAKWLKIGKLFIMNDPESFWPYFIEILYMIRNQLIHGEMEPVYENHKIVAICA